MLARVDHVVGYAPYVARVPQREGLTRHASGNSVELDRGRLALDLAREGATVLLSSHALTELEGQAGRVLVMNRGRLIADGTMEELRRLAGLPSVLRFRADGTPQGAARIGDHWQVKLSEAEKPAALRAALEAGARDITLEDPSLDDIYAHFLRREAA